MTDGLADRHKLSICSIKWFIPVSFVLCSLEVKSFVRISFPFKRIRLVNGWLENGNTVGLLKPRFRRWNSELHLRWKMSIGWRLFIRFCEARKLKEETRWTEHLRTQRDQAQFHKSLLMKDFRRHIYTMKIFLTIPAFGPTGNPLMQKWMGEPRIQKSLRAFSAQIDQKYTGWNKL